MLNSAKKRMHLNALKDLNALKESTTLSSNIDVGTLFARYQAEISHIIYEQLGSRDDAADLTQETFLRYSAATRGRLIENPRGFLLKTARNLVIDFLRRSSVSGKVIVKETGEEEALDSAPTVEQSVIDACELRKFRSLLDNLPPRCREVFILRKIEGRSYAEISQQLDISHSAIEKNIIRALKITRKRLGRGYRP